MDQHVALLYARKTKDGRLQTLRDHCRAVAQDASLAGEGFGLPKLLYVCGLLHDLGKCSQAFQDYLEKREAKRGTVKHAPQGAVYARSRWGRGDMASQTTADLMAIAIFAHHGKLPDLLNSHGDAFLENQLAAERFATQEEGGPLPVLAARFHEQVAGEAELDALFGEARAEVIAVLNERILPAVEGLTGEGSLADRHDARGGLLGFLQRGIFSALIDADRYDAYCFEAEQEKEPQPAPPWEYWREKLEDTLAGFDKKGSINVLRGKIADACLLHAGKGAGIYRLCVPTGGGKTFSVMRFALASVIAEAQRAGRGRIFYTAPYKAILEQTAHDLRVALGMEHNADDPPQVRIMKELLLEHHSDVTFRDEEEDALQRYQLYTTRWDSPLVLTTTVQFLNTLFSGDSACVRRFAALSGSVIILDEVQCVPLKCWNLLTQAIRYLTKVAGCAVVLCTATQPLWESLPVYPLPKPISLIADEEGLYKAFRRVELKDRTQEGPFSPQELAEEVLRAREGVGSALCILNTKATALDLYGAFASRMPEGAPLYCLTTYQCPAHRLHLLKEICALLKAKQPVVCVSTQLIEAGVNVSFGLVVRALAGLESVTQAAGRCNRHAEREDGGLGEVWLVRVEGERLGSLKEIQQAQQRTLDMLSGMRHVGDPRLGDLLSPSVLQEYFEALIHKRQGEMFYPLGKNRRHDIGSLLDLVSKNQAGREAYKDHHDEERYRPLMAQAFHTAGNAFTPIEAATTPVLVPWGEGEALIQRLRAASDPKVIAKLLRQVQPYCVGVYSQDLEALQQNHAITVLEDPGVYLLDKTYYHSNHVGLVTQRQAMTPYIA